MSDSRSSMRSDVHVGASRTEWLVAITILVLAFVSRVWSSATTGLEHFDEGVYAISAHGVTQSPIALFPNQLVFSPPFYFGIVGAILRLFGGPPDHVGVLVNVVLGTATVAAVWWIGRHWFGSRAAVISATLLALSGFHILMSRVMLTDVAFALWFVLALGTIAWAVERRELRIAVLAGVFTGLAWNTKYHGWFALLITGVALIPDLWRERRTGRWREPLMIWGVVAIVAALLYVPWAAYMRSYDGGYGGIVSYYQSMLGLEWFSNVKRHVAQQMFLENALTRAAPLAALAAGLLVDLRQARGSVRFWVCALALIAGGLLLGLSGVTGLLAVAAIPSLLREFAAYRSRVIICWMGLWLVAAPIYHPYARLILPFTIGTMLLSGWMLDRMMGHADVGRRWPAMLAAAGAALLAVAGATLRTDFGDPWRSSRNMAAAATWIESSVDSDDPVFIVGEPPVAHYLRMAGRTAAARVDLSEFDTLVTPVYLVTGVYTRRAPLLRARIDSLGPRLTRLATFHVEPNDLRLLDDLAPRKARAFRQMADSTFDLTLYRVSPAIAAGRGSSLPGHFR